MIEESIGVDIILGGEAQTGKIGDSTVLTDMRGGTTVQGTDRTGKTVGQGTGEITHLKKAGGTLVTTDEGDAKRPLVMEGLLQACQ